MVREAKEKDHREGWEGKEEERHEGYDGDCALRIKETSGRGVEDGDHDKKGLDAGGKGR